MSRLKLFLFVLIAAILLPRIYKIVRFLDVGETVIPHTPGPCEIVKGAATGSEDINLVPGTDVALISSGLRTELTKDFPGRIGNILYFDFKKPSAGAKPVTIKSFSKNLQDFNPHGISIYAKGKQVLLFVIDHDPLGDVVQKFSVDIKTYTITFLESITDDVFRSLNDLTATGERSFYYTNYKYYEPGSWMGTIETYSQLRLSTVGYFDGSVHQTVLSDKFLLNGINQSPDGKYIYLANIGDEEIMTFEREKDNSLTIRKQTKVDSNLDNIYVSAETGDLWLGCHPVGHKIAHFLSHQGSSTSPSQVLKIKTEGGIPTDTMHEIYADTGNNITASTVAVYHKNILLIGSISHNAVYCHVKHLD